MSIQKDLSELLEAGVISDVTAEQIATYYEEKGTSNGNRLFAVFGVLGAILFGLGIMLIIAHNWDTLSRFTKTILAFLPLLLGQVLCGYTLLKKPQSTTWREASSAFLFFAVGASIALVSQIYNFSGDLASFVLTWMLLCLPLVYVMRSSMVSLFYLVGITYYGLDTGYGSRYSYSYLYWGLLLLILPHYYWLWTRHAKSNFTTFHNWILPISILLILGTLSKKDDAFIFVAYMSLLGLFYLLGNSKVLLAGKLRNNGYLVLGAGGTIGLLLGLSFQWFWEDLIDAELTFSSMEFWVATVISLAATALLVWRIKQDKLDKILPIGPVFLIFILFFLLGRTTVFPFLLTNLLVFLIGVFTIRKGANLNHLGILNYGLLIITALVTCRFFDTDISFVVRGILFILVGLGFFGVNYWMLKKR